MKTLFASKILLGYLTLFVASLIMYKFPLQQVEEDKQKESINFNSKFLEFTSFGNHRLVSSAMWVQTLLAGDLTHYEEQDLNSWMFLRFKTIADLDPKFYENYLFGGQYLSIVKDDLLGANYIYERGMETYPDDFLLAANHAFNTYFELGDKEKGLKAYENALTKKGWQKQLPILPSIIARMKANQGELKSAFDLIFQKWKAAPEKSFLKEKYQKSLYAIKAEIDLDCLNNNKSGCSRKDFYGNFYFQKSGEFVSKVPWKKFRLGGKRKKGGKKPPSN